MTPPVITDEWWLKVVVDASRLDAWGMAIPAESVWGRWSFPLPDGTSGGEAMGLRLAWTALQRNWVQAADEQKITQITPPERVLEFIESQTGLAETCHDFPPWLATYAPQLTILGFGGTFETDFEELGRRRPMAEELMLRRACYRRVNAASVACQFVQGDIGGPRPGYYSHFEYLIWLLSDDSTWLPAKIRTLLRRGMREWNVWSRSDELLPYSEHPFLKQLWQAREPDARFSLTAEVKDDLLGLIERALETLELDESPSKILRTFIGLKYIDYAINESREVRRRHANKS